MFLDLLTTFVITDHTILLDKLLSCGVTESASNLVKNFLTNRKQYLKINYTESTLLYVATGVPQGSILGLLICLSYMNDMEKNASNFFELIICADDSTLLCSFDWKTTQKTNMNDINIELIKISEWLKANKLPLNVAKSKRMFFSPSIEKVTDTSQDKRIINILSVSITSTF